LLPHQLQTDKLIAMDTSWSKIFLTLLLCLFIIGCASTSDTSSASQQKTPWETRKADLANIEEWNIRGSISIQYQKKTDIASISWQQRRKHFDIALAGPLNFGRVEINGLPGSVTFKQGSKTASANSPEALLEEQMGWQLPISNLNYWVRGLPAPGSTPKIEFSKLGYITHLTQQGWSVEYAEYMNVNGLDLPKKIYLNNPALKLRLVIRQWVV
jgi:outer membrane lipoprotein LolB